MAILEKMMSDYKTEQAKIRQEQKDMTREDIKELMMKQSEYVVDLDNLKPQEHHWVDRGIVMSCEGAGHLNHRSFKR